MTAVSRRRGTTRHVAVNRYAKTGAYGIRITLAAHSWTGRGRFTNRPYDSLGRITHRWIALVVQQPISGQTGHNPVGAVREPPTTLAAWAQRTRPTTTSTTAVTHRRTSTRDVVPNTDVNGVRNTVVARKCTGRGRFANRPYDSLGGITRRSIALAVRQPISGRTAREPCDSTQRTRSTTTSTTAVSHRRMTTRDVAVNRYANTDVNGIRITLAAYKCTGRGRFTNRPYGLFEGFSLSSSHFAGLPTMYSLTASNSASFLITRS